jgi:hypothetical protein
MEAASFSGTPLTIYVLIDMASYSKRHKPSAMQDIVKNTTLNRGVGYSYMFRLIKSS